MPGPHIGEDSLGTLTIGQPQLKLAGGHQFAQLVPGHSLQEAVPRRRALKRFFDPWDVIHTHPPGEPDPNIGALFVASPQLGLVVVSPRDLVPRAHLTSPGGKWVVIGATSTTIRGGCAAGNQSGLWRLGQRHVTYRLVQREPERSCRT